MRALPVPALLVLGFGLSLAAPARAQLPPPTTGGPAGSGAAEPSGLPPPAPATGAPAPAPPTPAPGGAGGGTIPTPSANGLPLPEAQALTGAPNPSALSSSANDEWRFTWHGFTRTPMRIGFGKRPQCPTGTPAGTSLTPSGQKPPGDFFTPQVPCAGPGQSTTNFHSPFVPDSQYLDWRYDRQQEYDWTELFMNYGNSKITGTVGIMGFGFSDAEYFNQTNAATQFGIAQAYFTVHPDLGLSNVRLTWKVGAFQDRYGMAAMYDAGPYDTYMFGRTHQMGESLALEVDLDEWTLRISHGFGTRAEQIQFTPLQFGQPNFGIGSESNFPGFTLLNHVHAGFSYKKKVDVNFHLITSFANDYRAVGFLQGAAYNGNTYTDGHIDVYGAEATVKMGPVGGRLYAAYSRMQAVNPQVVGPANEAVHSIGGGNYESANGILENFLGCQQGPMGSGQPTNFNGYCATVQNSLGAMQGSVDTIELYYDYSIGSLLRHISDIGGAWDVRLGLFGMYSSVTSDLKPSTPGDPNADPTKTTGTLLTGDGVKKLKYGADLIITPLDWLGIGARADYVQPTSFDKEQSFFVISPKIMLHTKFASHEEFTLWYSHYNYGANVLPQPPNGIHNPNQLGSPGPFPPDENVAGIKGTMWW